MHAELFRYLQRNPYSINANAISESQSLPGIFSIEKYASIQY